MPENIPPIDEDPSPYSSKLLERAELEALDAESKLRTLVQKEIGQRYTIKWVALVTGLIVIVGMASLMAHLIHQVFHGPFMFVNTAFSVAMLVAPILSITAITVALFVGAFRKFEEKDLENVGSTLASGINTIRGG